MRRSLRRTGALMIVLLAAYILTAAIVVMRDRALLVANADHMDLLQRRLDALGRAEDALAQAAIDVSSLTYSGGTEPRPDVSPPISLEAAITALQRIGDGQGEHRNWMELLAAVRQRVAVDPSRAGWLELRAVLWDIRRKLATYRESAERRAAELQRSFIAQYRATGRNWMILAAAGICGAGLLVIPFFTRLARDLRRVEAHAKTIASGGRDEQLALQRDDEVGSLASAIDRIADDLRDRELRLEIERGQRAHREKMATVGALAAGVAHEVNNPLAAIDGLAQQLSEPGAAADPSRVVESARTILGQVRRAATVSRELADLVAPQAADYEWIDLNDLAQRATRLLRYDRRYRGVQMELSLGRQVPAVRSIGAAVQQVLMDLVEVMASTLAQEPGGTLAIITEGDENAGVVVLEAHRAASDEAGGRTLYWSTESPGDAGPLALRRSYVFARAAIERIGGKLLREPVDGGRGLRLRLVVRSS